MGVTGLVSSLVNLTGGADSISSYTKAAVAIGVVFAVIMAFSIITLHENDYEISEEKKVEKSNPLKDLGILIKTKNYLIVLAMGFICMFTQICMTSGAAYYAGYCLGDDKLTGSILMPIMGGAIIPMLLMGVLSKKLSKKNIVTLGCVAGIVFCLLILVIGANAGALMAVSLLEGISFGMAYVIFFAMQPDVVDEVACKHGRVMAGLQASLAGFACNLGSAVAASAVTGLIGKAGFDAALSVQPETVAQASKGAFIMPMIAMAVGIVLIRFFDSDEVFSEYRKQLGKPEQGKGN